MLRAIKIFLNIIPILIMVGLIPYIKNDYFLTGTYLALIIVLFLIKREKRDIFIFFFGVFAMTLSEYIFIRTGVETFNRQSLLGVMPIWLPVLWGYGFVVMKRCLRLLI